jgi:hypothetical protein
MNQKLQSVLRIAADNLIAFGEEHDANLTASIQDLEDGATFSMGFSIKLNTDDDVVSTKLSWARKYSAECENKVPDPNQLESDIAE